MQLLLRPQCSTHCTDCCCVLLQLWNLPWWSCSAGSCVDRNIDEIAYIESVLKTVLSKLSVDKSKVRQQPSVS